MAGRKRKYQNPFRRSVLTEKDTYIEICKIADSGIGNHSDPNDVMNEGLRLVIEKYRKVEEKQNAKQKGKILSDKKKIKK